MSEIKIRHAGGVACDCHPASQADESRGFPLTGGDSAPSADELASSRREAWQTRRYTHIVKRDSGYVAGWFRSGQEAIDFAAECNREVPGDPAHAEMLEDWPESWAITVMRHIRRNVII